MRTIFVLVFALILQLPIRGDQSSAFTKQTSPFAFDQRSAELDWASKDVRIERSGSTVHVILRRKTYIGNRRISVSYGIDGNNSSVTLIYSISVFVGPVTSGGPNFKQSDVDLIWTFMSSGFEKLRAKKKFYIKCSGETADIE